jgi:hypothetical protein
MRKRNINWLVSAFISLMMLLAFCPTTTAFADKQIIVFIPINETVLIPGDENPCGFDIVGHFEGRVKLTFSPDNPDLLVAEGDHLHGSFTNPENGKSISFITAQQISFSTSSDGTSITVTITGLQGRITAPGEGLVTADVGRIVLLFPCLDFQCAPAVVFSAGRFDGGPFPLACHLLAN